jgi:hypothetical protein
MRFNSATLSSSPLSDVWSLPSIESDQFAPAASFSVHSARLLASFTHYFSLFCSHHQTRSLSLTYLQMVFVFCHRLASPEGRAHPPSSSTG